MLAFTLGLTCHRPSSYEEQFDRINLLFQHGELRTSQAFARTFAARSRDSSPYWSAKFRNLEAESAAWRGMNPEALQALSSSNPLESNDEISVQRLAVSGLAKVHLHQFEAAEQEFKTAQALCSTQEQRACTELLRARAGLFVQAGDYRQANRLYAESLTMARKLNQKFDEAAALMNLGGTFLLEERIDEAIDRLKAANAVAAEIDAGDVLLNATGNLGWAYFRLGDSERALSLFDEAENRAVALGDDDGALTWLTTSGYVHQELGELPRSEHDFRLALNVAKRIDDVGDIIDCLEDLAHLSIEADKPDEATGFLKELEPMLRTNSNRLDILDVTLAQGRIAAARGQGEQAEALFRSVEHDPSSQVTMRLGAEHELAKLYDIEGRFGEADVMYATALGTFEGARDEIANESAKLPFLANATRIYDDYIQFLIRQGQSGQALAVADQSRARTLAQGLGLDSNPSQEKAAREPAEAPAFQPVALHVNPLHASEIARKANATLLFYWLGEKQSWLWAITPEQTALFPLPVKREITPVVDRYRQTLLGPEDPLESSNPVAKALYQTLVAPAKGMIAENSNVVILSDGALSQLNFEALVVPKLNSQSPAHYLIEDAAFTSAPSLHLLALARPSRNTGRRLLLLGDAVSPGPEYPELPNFASEMKAIQRHFAVGEETVFDHERANPHAYLASHPEQYAYIHFVAHGIASRTDPLDSAIILSRPGKMGDSEAYKLYAREILRHPIDSRLVTISACNGSGLRSYAGEGLVGLSWAFLHAGAHNVIASLWEASDESTPQLMNTLYQGLEDGLPPNIALRRAKLELMHARGGHQRPFFWAPFQLYAGL